LRAIRIIEPGPLATVQDLGRLGFGDKGVPMSGAMDQQALRIGNLLVGNPMGAACIEITLSGFRAQFQCGVHFALTGADVAASLDGHALSNWTCHFAEQGAFIELGLMALGFRTCLVIQGGIDVPPVMGSRSTFLRGRFGGFQGRPLRKEDILHLGDPVGRPIREFPAGLIPAYSGRPVLRAVPGPQDDRISPHGLETFFSAEYEVSSRSDRMGSFLVGPVIEHKRGWDIISDGICPGAVQVPGNGQPVMLVNDCQTTGGYVKVATVIVADLSLAGQLGPGVRVGFEKVSLDQARLAYLRNEYLLRNFYEKYGKPT
jgi:biotin-dependent carboxylase-like uncharacterized protein